MQGVRKGNILIDIEVKYPPHSILAREEDAGQLNQGQQDASDMSLTLLVGALEGEDCLKNNSVDDARLNFTSLDPAEKCACSSRVLGMILQQVTQKNVRVQEDRRHLAAHSLNNILRYRLFRRPAQVFRGKHSPVVLDRPRGPLDDALGALEANVSVFEDKRDWIAPLEPQFTANLGGDGNLSLARYFGSQLSHCTTT
jgi:hypothetical protein